MERILVECLQMYLTFLISSKAKSKTNIKTVIILLFFCTKISNSETEDCGEREVRTPAKILM